MSDLDCTEAHQGCGTVGPATPHSLPPAKTARQEPRVTGPASELGESERYCTCCRRPLKAKVAWLELDQRTDTYHDRGNVPPDKSQGWFPFGISCARTLLAKANAA